MSLSEGTQVNKRIQRVLEIVWLLQGRKSWGKYALAELYGVSDRTIKRDMELLQGANVPITRKGSSYSIESDKLTFPQLSRDELIALIVGAQFPLPHRLRLAREVATSKLLAAASDDNRRYVMDLQDRLRQLEKAEQLAQPDMLEELILAELLEALEDSAPQPQRHAEMPLNDSNLKEQRS